ncbi:MAG: class I SAM-dependent methyltransferase [Pseudomonadales bacterium]
MAKAITYQEVERARRSFGKLMKEYMEAGGHYLDPAPRLPEEHVKNCTVVQDRYAILDLMMKSAVTAEVGVDKGEFSKEIIDRCGPTELHLFDIDMSRLNVMNVQESLTSNVCKLHCGESSVLLDELPDGYFDWIYIDGDHRYAGVKKDIDVAVKKVKQDGRLVFNDYAVWSPQSMMHCGVARAVNEFCIEQHWEFEYFCFQNLMYNDVAIRKL